MKRLIAALLLLPALAMGAANDLFINQRDPANAQTLTRTVMVPTADGIVGYAFTPGVPANRVPVVLTLGPRLTLSSGVLDAVAGAAQVQADWNAVSAPAAILNKPVLFSGAYSALTGTPSTFAPTAHTHVAADITSGVLATARIPALAISQTTGLQTALDAKFNTPAGTAMQYVRGDGVLATLPVAKRIETYAGTTNASGQITVTYSSAFPAVPVVQPPAPALANQVWTTVSSTTTGFTLQLNQRNTVTLLAIEVLLGATVPVAGTSATVLVVAQ